LPNVLDARLRPPVELGPADAIVVLGAGLAPDGSLDGNSERRTVRGIVLYRRHLAPVIVFGGPTYGMPVSEAELRARLARLLGVPADAIITDPEPRTTNEEAARLGPLLRARGARRVLLVTDGAHMARAEALFERQGLTVLPAPADPWRGRGRRPEDRLGVARFVVREAVARLYYHLAGYL
jgi:uncharacterized SAM-binding protein YcdF (DUF218 family)